MRIPLWLACMCYICLLLGCQYEDLKPEPVSFSEAEFYDFRKFDKGFYFAANNQNRAAIVRQQGSELYVYNTMFNKFFQPRKLYIGADGTCLYKDSGIDTTTLFILYDHDLMVYGGRQYEVELPVLLHEAGFDAHRKCDVFTGRGTADPSTLSFYWYDRGKMQEFSSSVAYNSAERLLCLDPAGGYWAIDQLLYHYHNGTRISYTIPFTSVGSQCCTADGDFWFLSGGDLCSVRSGTFQHFTSANSSIPDQLSFSDMAVDFFGTIWLRADSILYQYQPTADFFASHTAFPNHNFSLRTNALNANAFVLVNKKVYEVTQDTIHQIILP